MARLRVVLLATCIAASSLFASGDHAGAVPRNRIVEPGELVDYRPPVAGEVIDTFRPPATPYGPGNRGIDYATDLGEPVRAAAAGDVVFAGRVGHGQHVVLRHADGLRTTYAFLRAIAVTRGDRLTAGAVVGTSGTTLHFGARAGDVYVDPRRLFRDRRVATHAHLVDDDAYRSPIAAERDGLISFLRRDDRPTGAGPAAEWARTQQGCTPATEPTPPVTTRRHAVLVGGLGSATGSAAILGVDTVILGYAPGDVEQFSYRADGLPYGPADTQRDINASARLLVQRLAAIHAAQPGVPIDVFAHSQGGLLVRAALMIAELNGVATVATIGTPHGGNTLAAAAQSLDGASDVARRAFDVAGALHIGGIDPTSTSVAQLAAGSPFLSVLASIGPPDDGVNVVAIAASTDAVVPVGRAAWPGVPGIVVDLDGPPTATDHARIPADPAVTRELALAIAGERPTCVAFDVWQRRNAVGAAAERAQRVLAGAIGAAARWADGRVPAGGGRVVRR